MRPIVFAVAMTSALLAAEARAQAPNGGIALNRFQPPPTAESFMAVPGPSAGGHLVPGGFVAFDYAGRPLVLQSGSNEASIVGQQGFLWVGASFALWDRLLVSAALPVAVVQGGDSPRVSGFRFPSPASAQVGDLRIGLQVRLFGEFDEPFQIAANAYVHAPTAPADSYAGEDPVRISPQLLVGGRVRWFRWSASVGATFRGSNNPATIEYGAGLAAVVLGDRLHVGPEIFATTPLQESFLAANSERQVPWGLGTGAEVLLAARVRAVSGLVIGLAGGPGLGKTVGTPAYRVVASLGWAPVPAKQAAPGEVKPAANADTDEDGILDSQDSCPYASGDRSADKRFNGCPAQDRDEDGIPDPADACPDTAGKSGPDPAKNGCPPDRDGDGVPDALDACPDRKGNAPNNGCP